MAKKTKISKRNIEKYLNIVNLSAISVDSHSLPKASFLFVTYNRCPSQNHEQNPLFWAINSILESKIVQPFEIIVIDDNSNDCTAQTIKKIKKNSPVNITYSKNHTRKGCSFSRNQGLKKSKNDIVIMGDDDCIYKPYFFYIALKTYDFLIQKSRVDKVAVVNFPVYEKSSYPNTVCSIANFGKVDLQNTVFYHNFDSFAEEYILNPRYQNDSSILAPIRVDTFSGINLCHKKLIQKVGGYIDLSHWDNDYSEHIELSHKLRNKDLKIFHQSDPRSGSIHLKYGRKSLDKFDKRQQSRNFTGIKYSFGDIVRMSEKIKTNTGCSYNTQVFHENEIGALLSFYLKVSEKLAIKFSKKEFKNFVLNNCTFSTTPNENIKDRMTRYEIWKKAVVRGTKITSKQTGINYKHIQKELLDWSAINIIN